MEILHNAKIYTLNHKLPEASVLVLDGERIIAVGGDELKEQFRGRSRDVHGLTILPGLTDAHIHLQLLALSLLKVDCETRTRAACLERVSKHAGEIGPGEWVLGHGWNQNDWPEGFGTASDLDAISPAHPVYLTAKSLHAGWVNSAALKLAGITENTPDPEGGCIQRDESGRPNGIVFEKAMRIIENAIPKPDVEDLAEAIKLVQGRLWRYGLTGVHDFDRNLCLQALQHLEARGDLHLRVVKLIHQDDFSSGNIPDRRKEVQDGLLCVGPVKVFADGALGSHTAAMLESYDLAPDSLGMLILNSQELFEAYGIPASDLGLALAVHAIGDRAVREVLDAIALLRTYERSRKRKPLRHRIEHVQLVHSEDAGRLAELEVIASMQPLHATSDMETAERLWGERCVGAYALRTQLDHGARLAFGSDAPVESPNPFLGLHAAVTRRRLDGSPGEEGWYPKQRLTLEEAVRGYTLGPAFAAGMEDHLGMLVEGFMADLIVLEKDPFACQPCEIASLQPVATMVAGEWVWQS